MNKNQKIDQYIFKSAPFAQEILVHFRALVHKACPEVEEKIKWGMPFFDYKGEMMCNMAAFKNHCAIGFWKATLMKDADTMAAGNNEAMGHYGKITSVKDLPANKVIIAHIKEAMKLNEDGVKVQKKTVAPAREVPIPDDLLNALSKNKSARQTFDGFPPSHRKEYIEWINEAKTAATKEKRILTTIDWLKEGKSRHWKYQKK